MAVRVKDYIEIDIDVNTVEKKAVPNQNVKGDGEEWIEMPLSPLFRRRRRKKAKTESIMEKLWNFLWPTTTTTSTNEKIEEEFADVRGSNSDDLRECLWKYISNNGLYVDYFASKSTLTEEKRKQINAKVASLKLNLGGKNNKRATMKRVFGNLIICPQTALDVHNESLRYATAGSMHVPLAYANRAACFYELHDFDEALKNIELAMEYDIFPDHLDRKLLDLKKACICIQSMEKILIENDRIEELYPKGRSVLDYRPNEDYPCVANVVQIKESKEFGRYAVAKCNIPKKRILLIEEDYLKTIDLNECRLRTCTTCFTEDVCFIACEKCADAMFCNQECKEHNETHIWECNNFISTMDYDHKFIIHSILRVLHLFTTGNTTDVNELIEFIEQLKRTQKFPKTIDDSKSKYEFFFNLASNSPSDDFYSTTLTPLEVVYLVYKMLMKIPKIKKSFLYESQRIFLQHLIIHHIYVIKTNCFGDDSSTTLGLVQSLFNHSCDPNLCNKHIANEHVFYSYLEDVKKGDQLYISYINFFDTTEERRAKIKKIWGFLCTCGLCEPTDVELKKKATCDPFGIVSSCYRFS